MNCRWWLLNLPCNFQNMLVAMSHPSKNTNSLWRKPTKRYRNCLQVLAVETTLQFPKHAGSAEPSKQNFSLWSWKRYLLSIECWLACGPEKVPTKQCQINIESICLWGSTVSGTPTKQMWSLACDARPFPGTPTKQDFENFQTRHWDSGKRAWGPCCPFLNGVK